MFLCILALLWRLAIRRPGARAAEAAELVAPPPPRPRSFVRPPPVDPSRPLAPGFVAVRTLAHLHGRLVQPPGVTGEIGWNSLEAEAAGKRYPALVQPDGRFSLHLPAGTYTLTALTDEAFGRESGVVCAPDSEREVLIKLQSTVAIEGRLHAPRGHVDAVAIILFEAGTDRRAGWGEIEADGRFIARRLTSGALYDLRIESAGLGSAFAKAVRAPSRDLVLTLGPGPVLRGAIGVPAGGACPVAMIEVTSLGDHVGRYGVDDKCRFVAGSLPPGRTLTVIASGPGWYLDAEVAVPDQGDPEPLCFNPPCAKLPAQESASLEVTLEGVSPTSGFNADVSIENRPGSHRGCSARGGTCFINEGLAVGVPLRVTTYSEECIEARAERVLHAGANFVKLACRRARIIEGAIRMADGGNPPHETYVRCAGEDDNVSGLGGGFSFRLRCARDQATFEYRLGGEGSWQKARVPERDPGWVDVVLPGVSVPAERSEPRPGC